MNKEEVDASKHGVSIESSNTNTISNLRICQFDRVLSILEDIINFLEKINEKERASSLNEVLKHIVSGNLFSFDSGKLEESHKGSFNEQIPTDTDRKSLYSKMELISQYTSNPVLSIGLNDILTAFKPSLEFKSKSVNEYISKHTYSLNLSKKFQECDKDLEPKNLRFSKEANYANHNNCQCEYSNFSDFSEKPQSKLEKYFVLNYYKNDKGIPNNEFEISPDSQDLVLKDLNNYREFKSSNLQSHSIRLSSDFKSPSSSNFSSCRKYPNLKKNLVETITNRNFDVRSLTNKYSLEEASFLVMSSVICLLNLSHKFDMQKLPAFNSFCVESFNSLKLPFHNLSHSLDVFHFLYIVLTYSYSLKIFYFTEVDAMAVIMAGLLHDLGHYGFSNDFHIKSISELAIEYNNQSIIQNFQSRNASNVFLNAHLNISSKLSPIEFKLFRKRLIESILATDMAGHTKLISLIRGKFNFYKIKLGTNANLLVNVKALDYIEEQQELINFIVHLADYSYTTKPFSLSSKWTYEMFLEFWNQGKYETILGLDKSILCDRVSTSIPAAQISFISGIAIPSFSLLLDIVPTLSYLKSNLKTNLERWENLERKQNKDDDSAEDIDDSDEYSEDERNLKKYNIASYDKDPRQLFTIYYGKIS